MEIIRLVRGLNDSADTRLVKRISERMQDARDLVAHGLPREAKVILDSILEQRKEHIPARILLGEILLKTGSADEAVKLFESLCEDEPDQIEARYQLAEALMACTEPDASLVVLKKLAADQPKKALRAWRRLRAIHMEGQRWEEALEAHKKLTTLFRQRAHPGREGPGLSPGLPGGHGQGGGGSVQGCGADLSAGHQRRTRLRAGCTSAWAAA